MSWIAAAKRRDQRLGAIAYDLGLNVPRRIDLRNAGYLEGLAIVHTLTQQYTTAGPTGVDTFGQYAGAINRVLLQANSIGNLFDCSGMSLAMISAIDSQYRYGGGAVRPTPPAAFNAAPATASVTNKWGFTIPVAIDLANKPWPLGLFQTALNAQEVALEVRFNPIAGATGAPGTVIYTGNPGNLAAGNQSGRIDIQQRYFDPIPAPEDQPTLGFIHRWRDFQVPLTADGDLEIRLPPSNLYCRIIMMVVAGSAGALDLNGAIVNRIRLAYGGNVAPFDETIDAVNFRMARQYNMGGVGNGLPAGVYVYDFLEETHTERDVINSAQTTDLRLVLTTSGGTYTGGAYVRIAVEELVPLNVPAPGSAGVQGTR